MRYDVFMGLSIWHLLILLVIVLVFFGPSRIEGIGSSLGKAIRGFKKGLDGEDDVANKDASKDIKKDSDTKQS